MYSRLCVFIAIALAWAFTFQAHADPTPPTFQAGEAALIATHFDDARRIYAAAATAPETSPKDRAASLRALAVMAWRLQGDNEGAERVFAQALGAGGEVSLTHAERARFYSAVQRHDDAIAAADAAVATAANNAERRGAALAAAHAILAKLDGVNLAKQTPADIAQLRRVRTIVQPFGASPPMPLPLSEALLEVALRLDDGPLALLAWRSYAREGAVSGRWTKAGERLTVALPRWRARGRTTERREEIVEALRSSQFFTLALLVATDERFPDAAAFAKSPRNTELATYARTLSEIGTLAEHYYRDLANGRRDEAKFLNDLMAIVGNLWNALSFDGPRPAFDPEAAAAELERRFGAIVNAGRTGGVQDLHYGHVFSDEVRAVEQYGRKASVRLVAIDRLTSNGYESWVWDGRQAHGGWASNDRIIVVRPISADRALRVSDRMTDPAQRAEAMQRLAAFTAADETLAQTGTEVYLPGLAARLEWQGNNAILDRLKAKGLSGERLKTAFLIEQSRIKTASSIDAHEGRHVLDKLAFPGKLDSEELEFRAKLSEVVFCEEPRIAFGSILNPNMADPTSPHGRANKRVAAGIVRWMGAHRAEINGIDPARPLLRQLDMLTDDQMREAVRSMDPWAKALSVAMRRPPSRAA